MTVVTLDSNDIPGILADAGVKLDPAPTDKPQPEGAKPEIKPEGKTAETPADDEEDDNGLTAAERDGLTERMQKTIGKQYRKRKEAEEFAAAQYSQAKLAEQRAAELERRLAETEARLKPAVEAPAAPEKPKREAFANEYEYVDAMIQWGVDERLREKAKEDAAAAEKRKFDERIETAKGRITRAIELVPDFAEVVNSKAGETMLSPAIGTYLEESEMVAELTYYLAKNPDVLVSLMKLSPHSQLVKIGKIESTLSPFESKAATTTQNDPESSKATPNGQAKPAPSADTDTSLSKPRGKAAPVITPLEGTGSAGISKDSKDMNIREHIEDFSKKNNLNLNQRKRH
jgi:hypothetical protein